MNKQPGSTYVHIYTYDSSDWREEKIPQLVGEGHGILVSGINEEEE